MIKRFIRRLFAPLVHWIASETVERVEALLDARDIAAADEDEGEYIIVSDEYNLGRGTQADQ